MKHLYRLCIVGLFVAFSFINDGYSVKAGPFGRSGSLNQSFVDGALVVDCDYHFFKCQCALKGDWPIVVPFK
jgi:hypothetical protein